MHEYYIVCICWFVAVTGNELVGFAEDDITDDFDPNSHDERMSKMFGDDFYGQDEEEKPVFPSDEGMCIVTTAIPIWYVQYLLITMYQCSTLSMVWSMHYSFLLWSILWCTKYNELESRDVV